MVGFCQSFELWRTRPRTLVWIVTRQGQPIMRLETSNQPIRAGGTWLKIWNFAGRKFLVVVCFLYTETSRGKTQKIFAKKTQIDAATINHRILHDFTTGIFRMHLIFCWKLFYCKSEHDTTDFFSFFPLADDWFLGTQAIIPSLFQSLLKLNEYNSENRHFHGTQTFRGQSCRHFQIREEGR